MVSAEQPKTLVLRRFRWGFRTRDLPQEPVGFCNIRGAPNSDARSSPRGSQTIKMCSRIWRVRMRRPCVVALRGEELRLFLEQYKASGLKTLLAGVPLDMIALWQASPESLQGVWVTSWYHGLERFSARELNRRFFRRFGRPAEGFAWSNWAAVKLVIEGVLRSASTEATRARQLSGRCLAVRWPQRESFDLS